jgi:hypothetical protein
VRWVQRTCHNRRNELETEASAMWVVLQSPLGSATLEVLHYLGAHVGPSRSMIDMSDEWRREAGRQPEAGFCSPLP